MSKTTQRDRYFDSVAPGDPYLSPHCRVCGAAALDEEAKELHAQWHEKWTGFVGGYRSSVSLESSNGD